jgi:hypothetical protein
VNAVNKIPFPQQEIYCPKNVLQHIFMQTHKTALERGAILAQLSDIVTAGTLSSLFSWSAVSKLYSAEERRINKD